MSLYCDCHVHIVGPQESYPWVAARTYTSDPALLADLQRVAGPAGVSRFVIVQPSFYGTDNSATLDALDALGSDGRGIAVVDPATVTQAALDDMQARGVRGLRINLYSKLASDPAGPGSRVRPGVRYLAADGLARAGDRPRPRADRGGGPPGRRRHPRRDRPLRPARDPPGRPGRARRCSAWSATARCGSSFPAPTASTPTRCKPAHRRIGWPRCWTPHPAASSGAATGRTPRCTLCPRGDSPPHLPYRAISYAALVEAFIAALPPGVAQAVMVDNPGRLYGFA